jgi:hypothetical protein
VAVLGSAPATDRTDLALSALAVGLIISDEQSGGEHRGREAVRARWWRGQQVDSLVKRLVLVAIYGSKILKKLVFTDLQCKAAH